MTAERPRSSLLRAVAEVVQLDWGIKVLAFVITLVLFVGTRDEVTRTFTVPLRLRADPERVLLTPVPEVVSVQVRGPWTRVSRIESQDFGVVTLDLADASPGPMVIDRSTVVMPHGVVLAELSYDEVDLRFDPVIERDVPVVPNVGGAPAVDYELVRVRSEPASVRVRGGRSRVLATPQLSTVAYDLHEADADVSATVALVRPPDGVELVGSGAEALRVRIIAEVAPKPASRTVRVPVSRDETLASSGMSFEDLEAEVRGGAPSLRALTQLDISPWLVGVATARPGDHPWVEIHITWAPAVPEQFRRALTYAPAQRRIELPPPPSPLAPEPTAPGAVVP